MINNLLTSLGGRDDCIMLILLLVTVFFLNSFIKNKKTRIFSSVFSSIFIIAQLISLYFTQSFIGYKFYVHANLRGVTQMQGFFETELIIICICILTIFVFLFLFNSLYLWDYISKKIKISNIKYAKLFLFLFCIFIILTKGQFINDTKTLLPIFAKQDNNDFKSILIKNGFENYITPENIESSPGKNIIVISVESLEKGFLIGDYSTLTPNLNKLKTEWQYLDIEQNSGSEWTSGSLYTFMTGFPAYFGVHGNGIFQSAYHSNISSIAHALKKSNYRNIFLNGNTDHAGTKEMLNMFEFDQIIDYRNSLSKNNLTMYGLHDKDLFEFAKKEIIKNKDKQFALFISTTDTHFPNGMYDARMEELVTPKKTELEFCIASVDFLIGELVDFLKKNNYLENTAIYIFPDHLKMGDPSILENTGKRGLYCITNTPKSNNSKTLFQIDLPKIILNGANVKHNLKFLTDYIKEDDKNNYIENNILTITEINTSGIINSKIKPLDKNNISKN